MATKNRHYSSTCIDFDKNDETELTCFEIFNAFGKFRKLQLQFLLTSHFPDYYKTGKVDGKLKELTERFEKEYSPVIAKNPMFFGWCYLDNVGDKLSDDLFNRILRGGSKDFIVYLLKKTYPYMFKEANTPYEATPKVEATAPPDNEIKESDETENEAFLKMLSHQFDHMNR